MRFFMEVQIPVEKGNSAKSDGSMLKVFQSFIDKAKPEAAYFHMRDGKRAAIFVFEEADAAKLMGYNEPFFSALDAEIWIEPTLNLDDLKKNM